MPKYQIRLIDSEFDSTEESDYHSIVAASKEGIRTAARVAADRLEDGMTSEAIEIRISEGDRIVARHVVSLSVSNLDADA